MGKLFFSPAPWQLSASVQITFKSAVASEKIQLWATVVSDCQNVDACLQKSGFWTYKFLSVCTYKERQKYCNTMECSVGEWGMVLKYIKALEERIFWDRWAGWICRCQVHPRSVSFSKISPSSSFEDSFYVPLLALFCLFCSLFTYTNFWPFPFLIGFIFCSHISDWGPPSRWAPRLLV